MDKGELHDIYPRVLCCAETDRKYLLIFISGVIMLIVRMPLGIQSALVMERLCYMIQVICLSLLSLCAYCGYPNRRELTSSSHVFLLHRLTS